MIDFIVFTQKYIEHLSWLHQPIPSAESLENIYALYSAVTKNGGWARTVGLNNWEELSKNPDPRKLFESNYLVSFEHWLTGTWNYSPAETLGMDFSLLRTVPISSNVKDHEWEELLADDLAIVRDVYKMGISKDLISLDSLSKNHGDMEISVITQESDTSGFNVKSATKQIMLLKDYISIMTETCKDEKYIRFAVNIDFGDWQEEVDELRKKLPSKILWCSDEDALKHLRQHIMGMTLPQLYVKINGCWTGGHEENLRFPAANINHGPSSCEWWGLDRSQSLQLRECIKNDKGFEIYNTENLWWPDEIYCIFKGFNVFHVLQQPGDLVIVGPGTIHWVKSCGITANSAWNFGPKYFNNFKNSFEREYINNAISYKSIVPMHALSLDLLNMELDDLDLNLIELLKDQVNFKSIEEENEYKESQMPECEVNNSDNVINCEICYKELFRFYYKCKSCVNRRYMGKTCKCFFCLDCAKNMHKLKCRGKIIPVQKFLKEDLQKLLEKISLRLEGVECTGEIEELKFPYDKNLEEGVYVSKFNGVKDVEIDEIVVENDESVVGNKGKLMGNEENVTGNDKKLMDNDDEKIQNFNCKSDQKEKNKFENAEDFIEESENKKLRRVICRIKIEEGEEKIMKIEENVQEELRMIEQTINGLEIKNIKKMKLEKKEKEKQRKIKEEINRLDKEKREKEIEERGKKGKEMQEARKEKKSTEKQEFAQQEIKEEDIEKDEIKKEQTKNQELNNEKNYMPENYTNMKIECLDPESHKSSINKEENNKNIITQEESLKLNQPNSNNKKLKKHNKHVVDKSKKLQDAVIKKKIPLSFAKDKIMSTVKDKCFDQIKNLQNAQDTSETLSKTSENPLIQSKENPIDQHKNPITIPETFINYTCLQDNKNDEVAKKIYKEIAIQTPKELEICEYCQGKQKSNDPPLETMKVETNIRSESIYSVSICNSLPNKRVRSAVQYTPVIEFIPLKHPKIENP